MAGRVTAPGIASSDWFGQVWLSDTLPPAVAVRCRRCCGRAAANTLEDYQWKLPLPMVKSRWSRGIEGGVAEGAFEPRRSLATASYSAAVIPGCVESGRRPCGAWRSQRRGMLRPERQSDGAPLAGANVDRGVNVEKTW